MDVISFLLLPSVAPFSGALAVVAILFIFELCLTLTAGTGACSAFDALMPDAIADSFLNWLLIRDVPMLAVLATLVFGFGASGVAANAAYLSTTGEAMPMLGSVSIALVFAFIFTYFVARVLARMKFVNSSALPASEFIGQSARILSPAVRKGFAGEARFTDKHGHTHYVMVEPAEVDEELKHGDIVVLNKQVSDSLFLVAKS